MFIRKKKIKGKTYYYLVESYREGAKVKQRVIKYLGANRPAVIDGIERAPFTGKKTIRQILDVRDMEIEVKDGKLIEIKGKGV